MNEDERDRILLLERIDNLSWERDRLREALRELVDDCSTFQPVKAIAHGDSGKDYTIVAYTVMPGTLQRARAALGEGPDGS